MDDQFDKELKDHIRKVFDNYEDASADAGWLLLREKFPSQQGKRRAIVWLWWSAAAIVLLCASIALWEYNTAVTPKNTVVKTKTATPGKNLAATHSDSTGVAGNKPNSAVPIVKQVPANNIAAVPVAPQKLRANKNIGSGAPKPAINNAAPGKQDILVAAVDIPRPKAGQVNNQQNAAAVKPAQQNGSMVAANNNPPQKLVAAVNTDTAKRVTNPVQATQLAANTPNNSTTGKNTAQPKLTGTMLADNIEPKHKRVDDLGPRVRFGVFAGTFVNYSRGSGNQRNVGGGFTTDIRLTKNLKLVTGVSVSQNSLNFNTGVPIGSQQNNFPGANLGAAASAFDARSSVTVATMPAFKNYGANLVGLDIPVNLKYDFNPQKNDFYFLAGLSSGTFINETYTYKYNYPALASPTLQQIQNETSHKTFDSFYFGKMLNLAVGVGYPVGRNRIILEPFIKYPLDGLGAQNLRFGSGGINLKFNFVPGRK